MEKAEILRNIKRMKPGQIDRYEGLFGSVDVRKSSGGALSIIPVAFTMDIMVGVVAAISPGTVCPSPEDPNR